MRALCARGLTPAVAACDVMGRTPLHVAAQTGNKDGVAFLLDASAAQPGAVDAADGDGCTPLYVGVGCGSAAVVRLLLDRGADPNRACVRRAPLHMAVMLRHEAARRECTQLLLSAGANTGAARREGVGPLSLNPPHLPSSPPLRRREGPGRSDGGELGSGAGCAPDLRRAHGQGPTPTPPSLSPGRRRGRGGGGDDCAQCSGACAAPAKRVSRCDGRHQHQPERGFQQVAAQLQAPRSTTARCIGPLAGTFAL